MVVFVYIDDRLDEQHDFVTTEFKLHGIEARRGPTQSKHKTNEMLEA